MELAHYNPALHSPIYIPFPPIRKKERATESHCNRMGLVGRKVLLMSPLISLWVVLPGLGGESPEELERNPEQGEAWGGEKTSVGYIVIESALQGAASSSFSVVWRLVITFS